MIACADVLQLTVDFDEKRFCFALSFLSGSASHMSNYFQCVAAVNSVLVPLSYAALWLSLIGKVLLVLRTVSNEK